MRFTASSPDRLAPGRKQDTPARVLFAFLSLISAVYLLRDVFGVHFPDIVFSGLFGAAFLAMDPGSSMGLMMFSTAVTLPHNEIRFIYVLVTCMKLMRRGQLRLRAGMLALTFSLLVLQLIDTFMYSGLGLGGILGNYVNLAILIVLPLLWYSADIPSRQYRTAALCYILGALLGSACAFILTARLRGLTDLLTGARMIRLGITRTAASDAMQTTYNANQLGNMMALSIALAVTFMDKKHMPRLLAFPIIGYALFIIFLTRSRTAILLSAIVAVVCFWVVIIRRKQFLRGLILFSAFILIIALVATLFPGIVSATLGRFIGREDITNGRAALLLFYLDAWFTDPWCFFFGYGVDSLFYVLPHAADVPHNAIADVLVCLGVTGFCLVCGILLLCWRRGRRGVPGAEALVAYLPAIILGTASMAGQYFTSGTTHVRLCFLLLAAGAFVSRSQSAAGSPARCRP